MDDIDYVALGKRIKQYRKRAGLTQRKVAEAIDIETPNISNFERATQTPKLSTLLHIARVLNVTLDDLLCDTYLPAQSTIEHELARVYRHYEVENTKDFIDILEDFFEMMVKTGMIKRKKA